jgi:ATP-dependent exoDNAse (exonuclease V) beta subunit
MRWRLFIEEYSPNLHYIKGTENVAADALSRLGILNSPMNEEHFTEALRSELYAFDDEDLPETAFPLSLIHFWGKHSQQTLQSLRKQQEQNHFIQSNPSQGQEGQENSFAEMARLWTLRNYKQESSDGTTITLGIPVSI